MTYLDMSGIYQLNLFRPDRIGAGSPLRSLLQGTTINTWSAWYFSSGALFAAFHSLDVYVGGIHLVFHSSFSTLTF